MESTLLEQARATFAATAMYHFLFVPLTIGLSGTVAILQAFASFRRDATAMRLLDVFAPIFLVNFVCGMITGYPLRALIQNEWSSYLTASQAVFTTVFDFEDALLPVNITLVVLYVFGRKWLPPVVNVVIAAALCACLMAQGSAILAINTYMQYPVGVTWDEGSVRLPDGLTTLFANPMWMPKFMHQMTSAMTMGATFCVSIAAFFVLTNRHAETSRRVMKQAAAVGICSLLATMWYGHDSMGTVIEHQPMKFAVAEGIWDSTPGTGESHPFLVAAWPRRETMDNAGAVGIPGLASLLSGSHSDSITGIAQLVEENERRIRRSVDNGETLGYATLLGQGESRSDADIARAAASTVPNPLIVFWAFRVMVYSGLLLLVALISAALLSDRPSKGSRRILWLALLACPLPWVATMSGWVFAEVGRQPWVVTGVLSTAMGASERLGEVYAEKSMWMTVAAALIILGGNLGWTAWYLRRFGRSSSAAVPAGALA